MTPPQAPSRADDETPSLQAFAKPRDHEDGAARCADLLRRAILTHDALPGREIAKVTSWPAIIREAHEAYGYDDSRPPRFNPTPRDVSNLLPVMAWICWLEQGHNGERDAKIIMSRARRAPWWKLAQRFGRSERTVQRWYDGAVAAIYGHFQNEVWDLEPG